MTDWVFTVVILACVVVICWAAKSWDDRHQESMTEEEPDSLEIAILKHGNKRGKE